MVQLGGEVKVWEGKTKKSALGEGVEARLDKGRGPVATILVQDGHLEVGDTVVAGAVAGKGRALVDDHGDRLKFAGPATPVEVLGLAPLPEPGDPFLGRTDNLKGQSLLAFPPARLRG